MSFSNALFSFVERTRGYQPEMSEYRYEGARPDNIAPGIETLFWENEGPVVHKWLHYLPIYERYFGGLRGRPIRFLEIGVSKGGSLAMWRKYFGDESTIFGIDIDPACAALDGQAASVRIGSQADPGFLRDVVAEMGGIDVVLDDGSHDSHHIRASHNVLFPMLPDGGLYMIEDLHCAYWPKWSGGYGRPASFMTDVKRMIDDMHHWYHGRRQRIDATRYHLAALHVHDSGVVLEKERVSAPRHHMVGG